MNQITNIDGSQQRHTVPTHTLMYHDGKITTWKSRLSQRRLLSCKIAEMQCTWNQYEEAQIGMCTLYCMFIYIHCSYIDVHPSAILVEWNFDEANKLKTYTRAHIVATVIHYTCIFDVLHEFSSEDEVCMPIMSKKQNNKLSGGSNSNNNKKKTGNFHWNNNVKRQLLILHAYYITRMR